MTDDYPLDDSERQLIALALAVLSLRRPGWLDACWAAAQSLAADHMFHDLRESNEDMEGVTAAALEESVRLQSHYAKLLNMYDGGERIGFANGAAWIERLIETKKGGRSPMTHDDWFERHLQFGWLKDLCDCYREEHDWDADEDPSATSEMLGECMRIYDSLMADLGAPPPIPAPPAVHPKQAELDALIPF